MNEAQGPVTACLNIIGNEILSGRTVDANLAYIARRLGEVGIRMAEARVVPDDETAIVDAVNACRARHTYEGVELIDNPISVAPGFRIENVHVLPGVPQIMQAMLDGLLPKLRGGARVLSRAITVLAPEGDVAAAGLGDIQVRFPALEIGSYPFWRPEGPGTTIVFRGTDQAEIDAAVAALLEVAVRLDAETRENPASG